MIFSVYNNIIQIMNISKGKFYYKTRFTQESSIRDGKWYPLQSKMVKNGEKQNKYHNKNKTELQLLSLSINLLFILLIN